MTDADIAHAKARAQDVIDGFMQVRITQARDVVKLANELQAANRKIDALSKPGETLEAYMQPGFFDEIFGGKK